MQIITGVNLRMINNYYQFYDNDVNKNCRHKLLNKKDQKNSG